MTKPPCIIQEIPLRGVDSSTKSQEVASLWNQRLRPSDMSNQIMSVFKSEVRMLTGNRINRDLSVVDVFRYPISEAKCNEKRYLDVWSFQSGESLGTKLFSIFENSVANYGVVTYENAGLVGFVMRSVDHQNEGVQGRREYAVKPN